MGLDKINSENISVKYVEKMEDGHDEESEKGEKLETGLRFLFYSYRTSRGDCGHHYPVIAEFLRASIFYSLIAIDLQLYGFVFGRKILCF